MAPTLAALLAGLGAGIWLQAGGGPNGYPAFTRVGLLLAMLLLGGLVRGRGHVRPWLRGLAIATGIVPLAMLWAGWRTPMPGPLDPATWAPLRHAEVRGVIVSDPRRTERGLRFELAVEDLLKPYPLEGTGRILVRVEDEALPGGAIETLRYGQRVRLRGSLQRPAGAQNPGEFDYPEYLARQGVFSLMNAQAVAMLPRNPRPSFVGGAIAFKNEALALLSRHLPAAQAALLGSLLFGDGASPIDPETADAFRALGLAHVLAVSGAQILFLWGMLKGLIMGLGMPRGVGILLGCTSLWAYATMTGLPPSVVRATWMGCALIVGWAVQRPWLRYLTLQAVVLGMLLHCPTLLFDVGFQFSAIATFALLHTAPRLLAYFRRLPEALAQACAMALAAGIWVMPLQIFHFGQFSPYSLPLNAVTCFMVEAVTVLGFVALLGGSISDLLGHHLLSGAYLLLQAFTGIVMLTLPLPGASQFLRLPPAFWLVTAYLCLTGGLFFAGRARSRLGAGLLLTPLLLYGAWDRLDRSHDLEIVTLGVGQGDAIVVRTPSQRWYLIDGGPCWTGGDAGERTILPYLRRQGCKQLDGIILTHAHDDHAGGLASVTAGLPVAAVWDAGQAADSPAYQRWLERVLERHIPLVTVQAGMRAELEPGLSMEVLGPPKPAHRGSRSDANNNSIVMRLVYRNFRMLFAGDLEREAEAHLLRQPEHLRATLLKVAHHGSRYGSGTEFLKAVRPQASIISVGARNTFRHPAPETLSRLRPYGRVYRTDQNGAVTVRSDGVRWSLTALRD